MLATRDDIKHDKVFGDLEEAILGFDQRRTTELFRTMVAGDGRSLGEALSVVMEAEAPYIQVPNHVNVKNGDVALVNNDHTIFGLRTSLQLMDYMPRGYELLPLLQSVWYIPAGLDIWNQLLFRYPGRYALMKGVEVPKPSHGPAVWIQDQTPTPDEGPLDERLHRHLVATMAGDVDASYAEFLGLAADPAARPALRDQLLFLGAIDVQDTVAGRKARNTGHKAIRARATLDLADAIGWERAHGVFYAGVPDMAVPPLYYSLYDAACVTANARFPEGGRKLKATNTTPLTADEVDAFITLVLEGEPSTVWDQVSTYLEAGKSIASLGDALQIAGAEIILRWTSDPAMLSLGQHVNDYCNVVNYWFRSSDNPLQPRVVYLMAAYANDVSRSTGLSKARLVLEDTGAATWTADRILRELDDAIMALDVSCSTSLAHAYLQTGADR
ncbi:MAG: hypothetical protein JO247_02810, partial [Chloroflexi bacterium]|nr:hypothetical protein [Chloroflexota bacterium]